MGEYDSNNPSLDRLAELERMLYTLVTCTWRGSDLPRGFASILREFHAYETALVSAPDTPHKQALANVSDFYRGFRAVLVHSMTDGLFPQPLRDRVVPYDQGAPVYHAAGKREFRIVLELALARKAAFVRPCDVEVLADILEIEDALSGLGSHSYVLPVGIEQDTVQDCRRRKAETEGTYERRFVLDEILVRGR